MRPSNAKVEIRGENSRQNVRLYLLPLAAIRILFLRLFRRRPQPFGFRQRKTSIRLYPCYMHTTDNRINSLLFVFLRFRWWHWLTLSFSPCLASPLCLMRCFKLAPCSFKIYTRRKFFLWGLMSPWWLSPRLFYARLVVHDKAVFGIFFLVVVPPFFNPL